MYDSIEIENFRGLRHLRMEGLGRVNLIVGDNDVGKTSLLEALTLLGRPGDRTIVEAMAFSRGFLPPLRTPQLLWHLLFTDEDISKEIRLSGSMTEGQTVRAVVSSPQLTSTTSGMDSDRNSDSLGQVGARLGPVSLASPTRDPYSGQLVCRWLIDKQQISQLSIELNNGVTTVSSSSLEQSTASLSRFIIFRATTTDEDLATYFTQALDIGHMQNILASVRAIDPHVTEVSLAFVENKPLLRVSLDGRNRIPLHFLGDGSQRIVEMILPILTSIGGTVLIDEVDGGIHYRRLESMWRALNLASSSNMVQLFVSTHSWECIQAAVSEFSGQDRSELRIFRLERQYDDSIRAVAYDYETAEAAIDLGVEVR